MDLQVLREKSLPLPYYQSGKTKVFWYFSNLQGEIQAIQHESISSDWFFTGDKEKWKLILTPFEDPLHTGLYLQLDIENEHLLYRKSAHVQMKLWSAQGEKFEMITDVDFSETFRRARVDWGFGDFIDHSLHLAKLASPCVIEVVLTPMSSHEDSKYMTGYIGIVNEGTTCYVNSLLQTLFFLTAFRKAVYSMSTSLDDPDKLPLSLQLIFYHLQNQATPASARELLKSFGWTYDQFYVQHDIQEFNLKLVDTLERKMKGTASEGLYSKLFMGQINNSIKCRNIDYSSIKIEYFYELQLNVKGCKDLYESLEKYMEAEELQGENQYFAEGFGKQDARKEIQIEIMPPVLQIHLKRFEYDPESDTMSKINDRFEFYQEIDVGRYVKNNGNSKYVLFSILVHTGSTSSGHYFAYISPKLDENWYKFNDDSVDRADVSQAFEANFGGEIMDYEVNDTESLKTVLSKSDRSAYMLVYINSDYKSLVLEEQAAIPESLLEIITSENRRKQREQAERVLRNSRFDIFLVSSEMILGWDKPGISPPDNPLYPTIRFKESSIHRYQMSIPKRYKGKDLRSELAGHIAGDYRLWTFTPGYRNWEFKELKLNDLVESELNGKALFIDLEIRKNIFQRKESSWEFINDINISTETSQDTEIIEEPFEQQTPSHAKAIVVFKWYDWHNGNPKLTLFKLVTLTSTANISYIRNDLFESWDKNSDKNINKMVLHLEKCKIDSKNKEAYSSIYTYKLGDNYELTISKRGNFGVKHIMVDNGDAFIGEIIPDNPPYNYVDARKYINSVCDEISLTCVHYNQLASKFTSSSYGEEIVAKYSQGGSFKINTRLSYAPGQLLRQLSEEFSRVKCVSEDQIQLFIVKNGESTPSLVGGDQKKIKKNAGTSNLCAILENSNTIYFDIMPFPRLDRGEPEHENVGFVLPDLHID